MVKKKIDKASVLAMIDRKIRESVSAQSSKLSKEREKVLRYYNSEYPKRQHAGSASYVSTDVFDVVEGFKAQIIEVFRGSQEIVRFDPVQADDVVTAQIATDYSNFVFFRQNKGEQIISDIVDDALKARAGIVKVYWEEDKEYQDETFSDVPMQAIDGLAAHPDITEISLETNDPMSGTVSGSLTRVKRDRSQVKIEVVSPDEFIIDPRAKRLKGYFHGHRTPKTLGELKAMGFDTKALADVSPDADDPFDTSAENDARYSKISGAGWNDIDNDVPDELRKYWVYEVYTELPVDGLPKLHKIVKVGSEILDIQEVDRSPFHAYVPLRSAHSFWGDNFAARVIPYQDARTTLARGILDHTAMTTNPRYTVLTGGLVNPREMLDNRSGGVVNVTRPDAVGTVPQSSLNPFVFQMLQTLKEASENTTGVSSLSQGLNKDAISKQNSASMVEQLVGLSMLRQKCAVREFSIFLCGVYEEIYRLVIENEKRERVIEVAGQWAQINPQTWIERRDATPSMHLGAGEVQAEVAKYTGLVQAAGSNPQIASLFGAKGGYALFAQIMRLQGIRNIDDYLTPPDKLPPPQPDPMQIAQMKLSERQVAVQEMEAKTSAMTAQSNIELKHAKLEIERLNAELNQITKLAETQRKGMESAQKVDTQQRELAMAEREIDSGNADARTIISPT